LVWFLAYNQQKWVLALKYKASKSKEYAYKDEDDNNPQYPTPADTKKASFAHISASLLSIPYSSL